MLFPFHAFVQVAQGQLKLQELTQELDGNPPPPYVAESQATISNLAKQLADSQLTIEHLNAEIAQARATNNLLNKQIGEQQQTIIHLQKQVTETPSSPGGHRRQISVTVTQKLSESQATIANLTAQLAEAQKLTREESRASVGDMDKVGEVALTSRLDRLEEQNRQLMHLLQNPSQTKSATSPIPPTREPPARPAPRMRIER